MKINLLEKVTGFIVTLSVTALVITMPVMSQDDDEDAAELGAIEITGSRLSRQILKLLDP